MEDSPRLSTNARRAILQALDEGPIYIAAITLLELARLVAANRIESSASLDTLLASAEQDFAVLPITAAIAAATTRLPAGYTRDPADRIIAATALVHGATLITADQRICRAKGIHTLW